MDSLNEGQKPEERPEEETILGYDVEMGKLGIAWNIYFWDPFDSVFPSCIFLLPMLPASKIGIRHHPTFSSEVRDTIDFHRKSLGVRECRLSSLLAR